MKRILSLVLEGAVIVALLGFSASFIFIDFPLTFPIGVIVGIVLRLVIDYVWKIYNQLTGKSLD